MLVSGSTILGRSLFFPCGSKGVCDSNVEFLAEMKYKHLLFVVFRISAVEAGR